MLEDLDERKMSNKRVVKVRKFPGATTDDMYNYLMPLLQKQADNVILHVGTNDASSCNSSEIVNNILKRRSLISQKLPNANVILSKPIMRSDTAARKVTIEEVNKQLNDFDFDMIDNSKLSKAHLNGRGLHLNIKGMLQFARNLIEGMRKLRNQKKLAGQNVNLSKSHTPYDHHSRISPAPDDTFIHDSNVLKNSVNSPEILKNILSNEQHESITQNKSIKLEKAKSHILVLDALNSLSKEHQTNLITGYLNTNSLRNKINDLRKICRKTQMQVLCIVETKLDESFPDAQFHIEGYQYPALRKDR